MACLWFKVYGLVYATPGILDDKRPSYIKCCMSSRTANFSKKSAVVRDPRHCRNNVMLWWWVLLNQGEGIYRFVAIYVAWSQYGSREVVVVWGVGITL
jgi:hypothetical protein